MALRNAPFRIIVIGNGFLLRTAVGWKYYTWTKERTQFHLLTYDKEQAIEKALLFKNLI
jgi:hypothetical protein